MGNGFSAVLEPFQSVAKSVGDGLKGIKLPDNPLKGVSFGNKLRNFGKGVRSGLMGPKQVNVQVRTGPFGFGRATQMRSVSSTPMSVSGIAGDFFGHKISRMGRTGTKPIFSSSNKPSLFNRIKEKIKPTKTIKTTNIGNIELSNMSQQQQPPQEIQQAGKKKKSSKKEKYPSKKETTSHKKEKKPSENKKKPSKKEKKPSENKKKPSEKEKKPSENKKKSSEKEKKPSENKTKSKK
jgi:hypothetical protein